MNCPNCESPTLANQQFCRACGAVLMANERRSIPPQFWGLVMAFGGILIAMTGKIADVRWVTFTGAFISIAGMFAIAALSLLWQSRPRKRKASPLPLPGVLSHADTTNKLLPIGDNDFIPGVTERTTDLLKEPAIRSDINHTS